MCKTHQTQTKSPEISDTPFVLPAMVIVICFGVLIHLLVRWAPHNDDKCPHLQRVQGG